MSKSEPIIVDVYEWGGQGRFVGFICGVGRCAFCDRPIQWHIPLRMTAQPLLESARTLLASGCSPDTSIGMTHRGKRDVALRSIVGFAATLTVKNSPQGKPIFVKFVLEDRRRSRRRALREVGAAVTAPQNSERAGSLLTPERKRRNHAPPCLIAPPRKRVNDSAGLARARSARTLWDMARERKRTHEAPATPRTRFGVGRAGESGPAVKAVARPLKRAA
jgi:hypothetical protein